MQVKMKVSMSGPGHNLNVGDEAEFDTPEAIRLIQGGMAAPSRADEYENAMLKADAEKMVSDKSALLESAIAHLAEKRKAADAATLEAVAAEKTADDLLAEKTAAENVLRKANAGETAKPPTKKTDKT